MVSKMKFKHVLKTLKYLAVVFVGLYSAICTEYWISPASARWSCNSFWDPQPDPDEVVWLPFRSYCSTFQTMPSNPYWYIVDDYPVADIADCAELQAEVDRQRFQASNPNCVVTLNGIAVDVLGESPVACNGNVSPKYIISFLSEGYCGEFKIACPGYADRYSVDCFGGKQYVREPVGKDEVIKEKNRGLPQCGLSTGNPINIATGNKYQREGDVIFTNGLEIVRHYNSNDTTIRSFGAGWRGSFSRRIDAVYSGDDTDASVTLVRDDGAVNFWRIVNRVVDAPPDATGHLEVAWSGNSIVGFTYVAADNSIETYDADGILLSVEDARGQTLNFTYANSLLTTVATTSGRLLTYTYYPDNKVSQISSSNGSTWKYFYDNNNNLTSVKNPDGTTETYQYENITFPHALTGETDELGKRIRTWAYDASGRAILSAFGGSLSTIERNAVTYNPDGSTTTLNPLGSAINHTFKNIHGIAKFNSVSGACGSCGDSTNSATYDAHGNKNIVTDFAGNVTDYDYYANNLLQKVTHAVGTGDQYETNYIWDVDLRKPASITNADTRTSYTYNTRGQILSRTETDLATLATRTTTTTYYELPAIVQLVGKPRTIDGPRTDVSDITTYEYYMSDDPGGFYVAGDLKAVVDALSHRVDYLKYDGNGRPVKIQDANGVLSTLVYNARGWLVSQTTAGKTTAYTYDLAGNLTRVTQPDGSFIGYEYDDVHRQSAIFDNFNNRIKYTLDNAGNQVSEKTFDNVGVLRRQLTRVYDQLNRLAKLIDGNNDQTQFSYDDNGNRIGTLDADLNSTAFEYDALDRLKTTLDATLGQTVRGYDTRGNVVKVTDPRGNSTTYTIDGLSNQAQLVSPDTRITTYEYDDSGNRTAATDARGIRTEYSYDALNRLIDIAYPDSTLDVAFTYDEGSNGKGRLTRMTDTVGVVHFAYDARGNLITETRVSGSDQYVTAYAYNDADRLTQITYPSGMIINYTLDAVGRITAVNKIMNAVTKSVVNSIQYKPFGPMTTFTYGNGLTYSATYDQDYELDQLQSGSGLRWLLGYDAVGNIMTISDQASSQKNQTFAYDDLYRVASGQGSYGTEQFEYDANGNRTRYLSGATDDPYTYEPQSNRLATQHGWSFTRDAIGNRTKKLNSGGYGQLYIFGDHGRLLQTSVRNAGGDTVVGEYKYDGLGQRVSKLVNGVKTNFVYGLNGELLGEYKGDGSANVEYVYLNGQPIAVISAKWKSITPPPLIFTMDNDAPGTSSSGTWAANTNVQAVGPNYRLGSKKATAYYRWTINHSPGLCEEIQVNWVQGSSYSSTVQYSIVHGAGTGVVVKNHKIGGGQWQTLGSYCGIKYVQVSAAAGKTAADAVRFLTPVPPGPPTWVETIGYIHADHLGTPRQVTDDAQSIIWRWDGTPFGDSAPNNNPDGDSETFVLNLRFPGQYYDAEAGLNYNHFRDYDPSTGRYIESDPIGLAGGINTYVYTEGNPVNKTDVLGFATEMCTRNIKNLPFRVGPLYHQFICVPDGKDGKTCGGLGPTGRMFDSPGTIEFEKQSRPEACENVVDDNTCVEQCVRDSFNEPPPNYSVDLSHGQNCQEWANSTVAICKAQCKVK